MGTSISWGWKMHARGKTSSHQIDSRLDQFLITEDIIHLGGELAATIILASGSDHCLIQLQWLIPIIATPKPFFFKQFWLKHPWFKDLIPNWWAIHPWAWKCISSSRNWRCSKGNWNNGTKPPSATSSNTKEIWKHKCGSSNKKSSHKED